MIYVMGAGRSGSTILGVALGNCTEVFDAGELEAWLRRSAIPNFGGEQRNQFWSRVNDEVPDGAALFGDRSWRCFEHSSALLRIRSGIDRRRLRQRYRRVAEDLYCAVSGLSGASHVVDTSHYPLRARELQGVEGIDLYLVYLVRDPHKVVESFNRKDVAQNWKSPLATNVYLWLTHLLSVFIFLNHNRDRRLFLRHEDFSVDPEGTLSSILEWIHAPIDLPDLTSLRTGIPFQGNRLLRSEVLAFKGSDASSSRRLLMTSILQLPWAAIFSVLRPTVRPRRRPVSPSASS